MGERSCFIKTVLHVVNESKQWEINGNNLELVPLDGVQTVFLPVAIPLQSAYGCQLPPGGSQGGGYGFALVHSDWHFAYRA